MLRNEGFEAPPERFRGLAARAQRRALREAEGVGERPQLRQRRLLGQVGQDLEHRHKQLVAVERAGRLAPLHQPCGQAAGVRSALRTCLRAHARPRGSRRRSGRPLRARRAAPRCRDLHGPSRAVAMEDGRDGSRSVLAQLVVESKRGPSALERLERLPRHQNPSELQGVIHVGCAARAPRRLCALRKRLQQRGLKEAQDQCLLNALAPSRVGTLGQQDRLHELQSFRERGRVEDGGVAARERDSADVSGGGAARADGTRKRLVQLCALYQQAVQLPAARRGLD